MDPAAALECDAIVPARGRNRAWPHEHERGVDVGLPAAPLCDWVSPSTLHYKAAGASRYATAMLPTGDAHEDGARLVRAAIVMGVTALVPTAMVAVGLADTDANRLLIAATLAGRRGRHHEYRPPSSVGGRGRPAAAGRQAEGSGPRCRTRTNAEGSATLASTT